MWKDSNMYGYIYKRQNKINSKVYIGKHKYDKPELDESYRGSGKYFLNALQKYGEENFTYELIDTADSSDELNMLEKLYIVKFNCMTPYGYNLTHGGDGGDCVTSMHPDDYDMRSKKISESLTGHTTSKETRDTISVRLHEWYDDPIQRDKRRNETIELFLNADHRRRHKEGIQNFWNDKEASNEARISMSKKAQLIWLDDEYRAKQHATRVTEEYKLKMNNSLSGKTKGYVTINNGEHQKRVPPEVLQSWLNDGWVLGAKSRTHEQRAHYRDAALRRCGKPAAKHVKCLETAVVYPSIRECSAQTGISTYFINKSIVNNCAVQGYRFVLLGGD